MTVPVASVTLSARCCRSMRSRSFPSILARSSKALVLSKPYRWIEAQLAASARWYSMGDSDDGTSVDGNENGAGGRASEVAAAGCSCCSIIVLIAPLPLCERQNDGGPLSAFEGHLRFVDRFGLAV